MWQSLLFSQQITNNLSNRCGSPQIWVRSGASSVWNFCSRCSDYICNWSGLIAPFGSTYSRSGIQKLNLAKQSQSHLHSKKPGKPDQDKEMSCVVRSFIARQICENAHLVISFNFYSIVIRSSLCTDAHYHPPSPQKKKNEERGRL